MNNGKAKINDSIGNLEISIPSKKNWFILIFGTAWLGGWYFGFTNALTRFSFDESGNMGINGFMTFWLIGWTIGGLGVVFLLLWGYFGQERLEINSRELCFEKTIFGVGQKKRLDIGEVKNFRHEKINNSMFGGSRWAIWGLGPGKVKFDYGMKTYSFGLAVDDAEANHLAEYLTNRIQKN